jgi:hypothetical protein
MGLATFWAIFYQTHLVTLPSIREEKNDKAETDFLMF